MTGSALRIIGACGLGLALALPCPSARAACQAEAQADRLQGLSPEGDLILASGRAARLAGLRLPEAPPLRDEAMAWLRAQSDKPMQVQVMGRPDRWDRLPVRILPADGGTVPPDLAGHLVQAGLALVDAGPDDVFCRPDLLPLEAQARERRLGLWAEDRYKPLDVNQSERLQERIGTFVLVEGRVRSIGERKQRTYLNFGGHWAEDFTIIIPRKAWRQMLDRGWSAGALKGQRIRARGILQSWQGTAFSVVIPDMIERLEDERLPR